MPNRKSGQTLIERAEEEEIRHGSSASEAIHQLRVHEQHRWQEVIKNVPHAEESFRRKGDVFGGYKFT